MAAKKPKKTLALSSIGIEGFKSIRDRHDVELRQLTILAGANSTGKSSLMQPLLLLKQTVDSSIDPGPLKLDGPNVRFDKIEQALWRDPEGQGVPSFAVRLGFTKQDWVEEHFGRNETGQIDILGCRLSIDGNETGLGVDQTQSDLAEILERVGGEKLSGEVGLFVNRAKCWMFVDFEFGEKGGSIRARPHGLNQRLSLLKHTSSFYVDMANDILTRLLHLPGLRGSPSRAYPASAIGPTFPGTFHEYAASMVMHWNEHGSGRLDILGEAMMTLGLTSKVAARKIDDTRIELLVGRTLAPKRGGAHDMVSIADVGFGVSQSLPVVVALVAAEPGQLVYIEQPETHLHPDAQVAMASLLADSAKRGAQVVVETHSNLLLLGIQTLVAEGKLDPALVKLHWFERDESGATTITPADLDEDGAFGNWPEDFSTISLQAQRAYLDAERT